MCSRCPLPVAVAREGCVAALSFASAEQTAALFAPALEHAEPVAALLAEFRAWLETLNSFNRGRTYVAFLVSWDAGGTSEVVAGGAAGDIPRQNRRQTGARPRAPHR